MHANRIVEGTPKARGEVHTPSAVVRYLNAWAIRSPTDRVLDLGVGHGAFIMDAYQRLRHLGAAEADACSALYGAERDAEAFAMFAHAAQSSLGAVPPHISQADFFDLEIPPVNAVIGNPPYVRRNHLQAAELLAIRKRLSHIGVPVATISGLSDLYCYFLYYADHFLAARGRLAVVISSSWLDVGYGLALKSFLLRNYRLRAVIGVEGRVFNDALVKCVVLLAEKVEHPADTRGNIVRFVRVHQSSFFDGDAESLLRGDRRGADDEMVMEDIPQSALAAEHPWSAHFKAFSLLQWVTAHPGMARLGEIATSRIGLQTFAKDFYIFTGPRARALPVEPEHTRPLAFSPREFPDPIIRSEAACPSRVLYCHEPRSRLIGTRALRYIEAGERQPVRIRGKAATVTGYQSVPKVQSAHRTPWYDLVTELTRHGRFEILLPRRMYTTYLALWNRAGVAANEDFIGVRPKAPEYLFPLLAFLNSSLGECLLRLHAQVYGGGVFNLNPGDVPAIPVLDVRAISARDAALLAFAYGQFCEATIEQRHHVLDDAVAGVMGLSTQQRHEIELRLDEMRGMARRAKVTHPLGAERAESADANLQGRWEQDLPSAHGPATRTNARRNRTPRRTHPQSADKLWMQLALDTSQPANALRSQTQESGLGN